VLVSAIVVRHLLPRRGVGFAIVTGCALACAALLFLAFASPPAPAWWRMIGLFVVGLATGMLNTAIFHAISPNFRINGAATVNLAGILFGLGSLLASLLVAGTFYAYSVAAILCLLALAPASFAVLYSRTSFPEPAIETQGFRRGLAEFKSPAAVLLALLLFLQFGNEWLVAGWMALFLTHRLGISPESSLGMVAVYWAALTAGRLGALAILPRVSHGRLLIKSAAAALLGCVILMLTDNRAGAYVGLLLIGAGFAPIYPLVAEKIGHRFTHYHPGLFNGIFSLAMVGAMLEPATAGYLAGPLGMGIVMALPLAGTCLVFAVILLIWLESKLGG
ncbi:MAG: MFS transporter, partial [Bryobacteraceae bacterium]